MKCTLLTTTSVSGLCSSFQPLYTPLPLCLVLSNHSDIFLFFGLTSVFFQFEPFVHTVPSSCRALFWLFTGPIPSHPSLLGSHATLSERFSPDYHIISPLPWLCPYPPIFYLHCIYGIGTCVVCLLIVHFLIFTIRMGRTLSVLYPLTLKTVPGL